jgi:hypothetical protein
MSDETDLRAGLCMDKDEMFLKPAEADATICAISTTARRRVCNSGWRQLK